VLLLLVLLYMPYLRNKTSVPVFYRRMKYRYEFGCVLIKARVRQHECLNYTHSNEYGYFIDSKTVRSIVPL